MQQQEIPGGISCPRCGSSNVAEAEQEFTRDYPFSVALIVVFLVFGLALGLFFLLQLHPVILILIVLGSISWLLKTRPHRYRKKPAKELICLDCDHRFKLNTRAKEKRNNNSEDIL